MLNDDPDHPHDKGRKSGRGFFGELLENFVGQ